MESILRLFDPHYVDAITITEVKQFAEAKYEEQEKIKGQIARDLTKMSENAFMTPSAYSKLSAKYKAANASKKKLAILEQMKERNCQ